MQINRWWQDDPFERYWMEITNRSDLGSDLRAPQVQDSGRPYWGYSLVTEVQDGDVVLHWHKRSGGETGIVGFSTAVGPPEESTIVWTAHGSYGRKRPSLGPEPSWQLQLSDYRPLVSAVTQDDIRKAEPHLRRVQQDLIARHRSPLYFPFAFSKKRAVRTTQGYLVKFPAAALGVLRPLRSVPRIERDTPPRARPVRKRSRSQAGYLADPVLRRALEWHAVRSAMDHYEELGFRAVPVGDTESYDVLAVNAEEERHVEVKGSCSSDIENVELTRGEVRQANRHAPTDLFVVDEIAWWRNDDGTVSTTGGRVRWWRDWTPAPSALRPTRYRYRLGSAPTLDER
ncbi:MAG: hypothetical protein QOE45_3378 [Frankiaceae bacterium]|jgi:hypothetical protein|nr:hypothetical protein [Frankiaceae bacterium]